MKHMCIIRLQSINFSAVFLSRSDMPQMSLHVDRLNYDVWSTKYDDIDTFFALLALSSVTNPFLSQRVSNDEFVRFFMHAWTNGWKFSEVIWDAMNPDNISHKSRAYSSSNVGPDIHNCAPGLMKRYHFLHFPAYSGLSIYCCVVGGSYFTPYMWGCQGCIPAPQHPINVPDKASSLKHMHLLNKQRDVFWCNHIWNFNLTKQYLTCFIPPWYFTGVSITNPKFSRLRLGVVLCSDTMPIPWKNDINAYLSNVNLRWYWNMYIQWNLALFFICFHIEMYICI